MATMARRGRRGLTLVELAVVTAIGAVVFGLILQAMIDTDRAGKELEQHQVLRQECVTISRAIERDLRFRAASDDLEAAAFAAGGAGQEAPAAGGTTPADAQTTAPAPVAPAVVVRKPTADLFTADTLRFNSLAAGGGKVETVSFVNRTTAEGFKEVVRVTSEAGLPPEPEAAGKTLGNNRDKVQAEVSFRYANSYSGVDAEWKAAVDGAPRLVEYTIRVWPRDKKFADYAAALADRGSVSAFEYTAAVALP